MITIRPGRKVYTIPGPDFGVRVIEPGTVAVAADWWLGPWPNYPVVDAIDSACAEGIYRAVSTPGTPWSGGPNVYADTLINLADAANPLTEGNGAVPWAQLTGWGLVAAALQYFITGLIPVDGWTTVIQFANCANLLIACGCALTGGGWYTIQPVNAIGRVVYSDGDQLQIAPGLIAGNLCIGGQACYRNGAFEGNIAGGWPGGNANDIFIGSRNNGGGVAGVHISADIKSVAIYSCAPTPGQVLALADPVLGAMPNL